jgi:hypothetical protein
LEKIRSYYIGYVAQEVQENIKNKIIYICCGRNNLFSAARIVYYQGRIIRKKNSRTGSKI